MKEAPKALAPMDFSTFVLSLGRSAVINLGNLPHPGDDAVGYPVSARVIEDAVGELDLHGTITVYKERYVHMEIDLGLAQAREAEELAATDPWPTYGDVIPAPDPLPVPVVLADLPAWQLQESRRIRGVNPQYFDHPQVGGSALGSEIDVGEEEESY